MPTRLAIFFILHALLGCASTPPTSSSFPRATPPAAPAPRFTERLIPLGESVESRPLALHILGDPTDRWPTFILAGIHGNEPHSTAIAEKLLALLRAQPDLLGHRAVAILTCANPDGLSRKLRTNKNLVDLNRNFPAANWTKTAKGLYFGGPSPSSEPETLALLKAFETLRPARVISIHSMPAPCNNYDGPAQSLAQAMANHNHYPIKASIGYPTPGSLGSWAGIDHNIPIITLELATNRSAEKSWEENRAALLAVIRTGEKALED